MNCRTRADWWGGGGRECKWSQTPLYPPVRSSLGGGLRTREVGQLLLTRRAQYLPEHIGGRGFGLVLTVAGDGLPRGKGEVVQDAPTQGVAVMVQENNQPTHTAVRFMVLGPCRGPIGGGGCRHLGPRAASADWWAQPGVWGGLQSLKKHCQQQNAATAKSTTIRSTDQ